jgi:hypothetical protein
MSVGRVLGAITNTASVSSIYRILKYDLNLTPYKISIRQYLKERDILFHTANEWPPHSPDLNTLDFYLRG